jgi:hypothetical protein
LGYLEGLLKSPNSGSDADAHLFWYFPPRSPGRAKRHDPSGVHHCARATEANASRNRRQSRDDPTSDQFALEFRNAGEDSEHQLTIRGGCIHALLQADEVDAQCTELL